MGAFYQPGTYRVRVVNQGFAEQENEKRTPYFFFQVEPQAKLDGDDEEACQYQYNRTIKVYVTEKTIDRARADLMKLGWDGAKFRDLDPATVPGHSFIGEEITATCKHEAGQGDKIDQTFEKWELPYEGGGGEPKASDAKLASKLDALFGKKARPAAKKAPPKPPADRETAAASQGNGTERDGDIPFLWMLPFFVASIPFV